MGGRDCLSVVRSRGLPASLGHSGSLQIQFPELSTSSKRDLELRRAEHGHGSVVGQLWRRKALLGCQARLEI